MWMLESTRKRFRFTGIVMILLLSLGLTACGNSSDDADADSTNNDNDNGDSGVELGDKDITLPYVGWAGVEARTQLLAQVLQDVGYNVETKLVEAGRMFSSVADGSPSCTPVLWLTTTH